MATTDTCANTSSSTKEKFLEIPLTSYPTFVNLMASRLPKSAHVYNMAMLHATLHWKDIMAYSLNGDLSEDALVVVILQREDYGQDINISIPEGFKVTDEIKEAFSSTEIINWDKSYWFNAVDRVISPMIFEISTYLKGNSTIVNPEYYHYMDIADAINLDGRPPIGAELQHLNTDVGLDFMNKSWDCSIPGSKEYMKKVIEKNPTSCITVDGIPVTGVMLNGDGMIGMFFTEKTRRGSKYARICMKHLCYQMATGGMIPASSMEQRNLRALAFHKKVGMKFTHEVDYIMYLPTEY